VHINSIPATPPDQHFRFQVLTRLADPGMVMKWMLTIGLLGDDWSKTFYVWKVLMLIEDFNFADNDCCKPDTECIRLLLNK